ncbi:MAG: phospho-sugar mutase [Actinomycetes bacterium]
MSTRSSEAELALTLGDRAGLLFRAVLWRNHDSNDENRKALTSLIERAQSDDSHTAWQELNDAFAGTLKFGTAGLRARMGPGPNRMNDSVVRFTAKGLAGFLKDIGGDSIVVGFDSRHNSEAFAIETARVTAGAGIRTFVLPRPLPTPVLAFAVRNLGCSAGVMLTASHNPSTDNGFKVYLSDGRQIVEPNDTLISQYIARNVVRPGSADIPLSDDWLRLTSEVVDSYLEKAIQLVQVRNETGFCICYTPLHGVGGEVFNSLVQLAGFARLSPVFDQYLPHPDFPTVQYPNPEEPGAMDLALAQASSESADMIIAHDPDADRCAVGLPSPVGWRMLTGDELGWLLAWWVTQGVSQEDPTGTLAQSIVSGSMLASIAKKAGLGYQQTLTGFKWISRVSGLRYGYEESLGYCLNPEVVADKDGITAGLVAADMTAQLKRRGLSPLHVLDELARLHGVCITQQESLRFQHPDEALVSMETLRRSPPSRIANQAVVKFDDLLDQHQPLPPTNALRFNLADESRVIIRPSGTEPKLKCYLEVVEPVTNGDLEQATATAKDRMNQLVLHIHELIAEPKR